MNRAVLILTVKPGKEGEAEHLNREFEPEQQRANGEIRNLRGWDKYILNGKYVDVIDYEGDLDDILEEAGTKPAHQGFLERMHPLIEEAQEQIPDCFMKRVSHYAAEGT
jgi:hypothetical protein